MKEKPYKSETWTALETFNSDIDNKFQIKSSKTFKSPQVVKQNLNQHADSQALEKQESSLMRS